MPIAITSIFCIGSEEYLVNCTYSTFNFFDTHDEDAGVECYKEKGESGPTVPHQETRHAQVFNLIRRTKQIVHVFFSFCFKKENKKKTAIW